MNNNGSETAQSAQKDEEFEAWWDNGGTSSLRTASRYHEDAHFHAKRGWDAHAERVKDDAEQLRVQLAGCSVAALGGTNDTAKRGDYGWSPAYQDVLDLRRRHDIAKDVIEAVAKMCDTPGPSQAWTESCYKVEREYARLTEQDGKGNE